MTRYACLVLPFPVSVNQIWRGHKGRAIKSKRYREFEAEAARALRQQGPLPHFDRPVSLTLSIGRPDKRVRDISNLIKAVEDVLAANGVLENDVLVHRIAAHWSDDVTGCRAEISLLTEAI